MDFLTIPFQLSFSSNIVLLFIFSLLLSLSCIQLIRSKTLLNSVVVLSAISILLVLIYLLMDAPDVAMTEAAIGACLSTCVLLNITKITGENIKKTTNYYKILASVLCSFLFILLCYVSTDLEQFGNINAPVHSHISHYYVENTYKEINIPSFVAAILASYRGFDTLGETTVILIAGLAVLVITSRKKTDA
ncbi:MAG: DUF4040 domain-containing protein [Proteobacteria bacterium]|nr:DUF4040 domain-containing protein [Pseudomonadota bacterium]